MAILTDSWFWFSLASTVSGVMVIVLTHMTLTRKHSAGVTTASWIVAVAAYFAFMYLGMTYLSDFWFSYLTFFGWMIFLIPPALTLYQESISTRLFTIASGIFLANVTTFMSGGISTTLIAVNPYDYEVGYQWSIPFTIFKIIISTITVLLYNFLLKRMVKEVFTVMEGKMNRFMFVPFITSIGFFFISQTVQTYGIMPDKGFDFILFYAIVCLVFALMYQLVFSNVLWSSRAMKTEAELNVASHIQKNMLPCIFPPYPEREEFDIYATMMPAKEVGGDFYDFFLIDPDHLAIVIADVSGKGVPAALFMVIAKTLIKNNTAGMTEPKGIFEKTNDQLCENNEEGMFVTGFMGILEISTGVFSFVNAGHNPPLLKRKGQQFDWLSVKPGFILAGMEGMKYQQESITLSEGDELYLYTDGVTEAMNLEEELFTDQRLKEALNRHRKLDLKDLLASMKQEIDQFANGAKQADDITMLALRINEGKRKGS